MDYVSETPPPTSRLSKKALTGIRRELRSLIRGLKRGVVMHQIGVKQAKEGRLIPKLVLRKCRSEAKKIIPGLLDQLEEDGLQKTQFQLYGHLTAYFASIYGHRLGVFQNLTMEEVKKAVKSASSGSYLINISLHKTNQAFGPAQLSLTPEEYSWFRRFLAMRDNLVGGPDATHFFYTSTPNPCKNLNNHFQAAWVSMGLPGKPTFTDLRTSIATHARNTYTSSNRTKVAKFMCHDTSTADKFYAMNLSVKQAVEHRRLFEEALCGEEVSPAKPSEEGTSRKRVAKTKHGGWKHHREESPPTSPSSSSSEVGETVTFQESGVSSIDSPSSLEEYPRTQGLASPPSPSSSDASRESRRKASPEVRASDQDDPEQEQDDPEQQPASPRPTAQQPASPATHKEPRRVVTRRRPVVLLSPLRSPDIRKLCRLSGLACASRARANLRRATKAPARKEKKSLVNSSRVHCSC
ncbi:uncharacterized protein [Misgurnus anguillicaudatus]|uniref:uncharacterized protein n=1 Tax=Misgurnus anguillicaudatus TaxID=75329 RepID=UPI003CCF3EB8